MNSTIDTMHHLLAPLEPLFLEITDDSARHAGHTGAASGGGHFIMTITSPHFSGKRSLERHRMVYDALSSLRGCGFHALSIKARAPDES